MSGHNPPPLRQIVVKVGVTLEPDEGLVLRGMDDADPEVVDEIDRAYPRGFTWPKRMIILEAHNCLVRRKLKTSEDVDMIPAVCPWSIILQGPGAYFIASFYTDE